MAQLNLTPVETAIRSIVPTTSPAEIMDAIVTHTTTIANDGSAPHRRRRRTTRRHGAYVRLRELEQSRQYNLQLDVIDLQKQLAELTQLRDLLASRTLNRCDDGDGSYVRTASVYYAIMGYGYRDVVTLHEHQRIDSSMYLQQAMAEDVAIGRFIGRQNFLPMMKRYSTWFSDTQLRLKNVNVLPMQGPQGQSQLLVRTQGDYTGWLTPAALVSIFPHVVNHSVLSHQLLSHPLRGVSQFDFVFDCESHRVVRFDADMNFLPAFMGIVPDPAQLAFLFSQAKISEEMFIGELDEFEETRSPPTTPPSYEAVQVSPSTSAQSVKGSRSMKIEELLSPERDDRESPRQPSRFMEV